MFLCLFATMLLNLEGLLWRACTIPSLMPRLAAPVTGAVEASFAIGALAFAEALTLLVALRAIGPPPWDLLRSFRRL